ncbi:MAG: YgjP-like metallopeptidase domain-containing protein [Muribaculaceae bacterium]
MATSTFLHPKFGRVTVTTRTGMVNIVARVKNGELHISAPHNVNKNRIDRFLENCEERVLAMLKRVHTNDEPLYYDGKEIECFGFKVLITSDKNYTRTNNRDLAVIVPKTIDFTNHDVIYRISRTVKRMVRRYDHLLLDYANKVADELGVKPKDFIISTGFNKLGSCLINSGVIRLSYALLFLPEPLIRMVVCHELAHLSEPNHGARFHLLENQYFGSDVSPLNAQLKKTKWPVLT